MWLVVTAIPSIVVGAKSFAAGELLHAGNSGAVLVSIEGIAMWSLGVEHELPALRRCLATGPLEPLTPLLYTRRRTLLDQCGELFAAKLLGVLPTIGRTADGARSSIRRKSIGNTTPDTGARITPPDKLCMRSKRQAGDKPGAEAKQRIQDVPADTPPTVAASACGR